MVLIKEQDKYYVQRTWNNTEERIVITKEIYRIYMRPIWRDKKREKNVEEVVGMKAPSVVLETAAAAGLRL